MKSTKLFLQSLANSFPQNQTDFAKKYPITLGKIEGRLGAGQIGASDIGQWHGRAQTKLKSCSAFVVEERKSDAELLTERIAN